MILLLLWRAIDKSPSIYDELRRKKTAYTYDLLEAVGTTVEDISSWVVELVGEEGRGRTNLGLSLSKQTETSIVKCSIGVKQVVPRRKVLWNSYGLKSKIKQMKWTMRKKKSLKKKKKVFISICFVYMLMFVSTNIFYFPN